MEHTEVNKQNNESGHEKTLTTFSLVSLIRQMKEEESWEKTGRSAKTLHKANGMRLVLNSMKSGTEIKPHQANGPISVQCLEGILKFHTDQETVSLSKGEMLSLQENIRHSVEAVEETTFLLTIASPASSDKA